jgi:hypothetical protein
LADAWPALLTAAGTATTASTLLWHTLATTANRI